MATKKDTDKTEPEAPAEKPVEPVEREEGAIYAQNGKKCDYMINISQPDGESAEALKLIVNSYPYTVHYDKDTNVPAAVYHALKDATKVVSKRKRQSDGTMANMPFVKQRYQFSATKI